MTDLSVRDQPTYQDAAVAVDVTDGMTGRVRLAVRHGGDAVARLTLTDDERRALVAALYRPGDLDRVEGLRDISTHAGNGMAGVCGALRDLALHCRVPDQDVTAIVDGGLSAMARLTADRDAMQESAERLRNTLESLYTVARAVGGTGIGQITSGDLRRLHDEALVAEMTMGATGDAPGGAA